MNVFVDDVGKHGQSHRTSGQQRIVKRPDVEPFTELPLRLGAESPELESTNLIGERLRWHRDVAINF